MLRWTFLPIRCISSVQHQTTRRFLSDVVAIAAVRSASRPSSLEDVLKHYQVRSYVAAVANNVRALAGGMACSSPQQVALLVVEEACERCWGCCSDGSAAKSAEGVLQIVRHACGESSTEELAPSSSEQHFAWLQTSETFASLVRLSDGVMFSVIRALYHFGAYHSISTCFFGPRLALRSHTLSRVVSNPFCPADVRGIVVTSLLRRGHWVAALQYVLDYPPHKYPLPPAVTMEVADHACMKGLGHKVCELGQLAQLPHLCAFGEAATVKEEAQARALAASRYTVLGLMRNGGLSREQRRSWGVELCDRIASVGGARAELVAGRSILALAFATSGDWKRSVALLRDVESLAATIDEDSEFVLCPGVMCATPVNSSCSQSQRIQDVIRASLLAHCGRSLPIQLVEAIARRTTALCLGPLSSTLQRLSASGRWLTAVELLALHARHLPETKAAELRRLRDNLIRRAPPSERDRAQQLLSKVVPPEAPPAARPLLHGPSARRSSSEPVVSSAQPRSWQESRAMLQHAVMRGQSDWKALADKTVILSAEAGQWKLALKTFHQIERHPCDNSGVVEAIAQAALDGKCWWEAGNVVSALVQSHPSRSVVLHVFGCLARLLGKCRRWEDAKRLLAAVCSCGMTTELPDPAKFALLEALESAPDHEECRAAACCALFTETNPNSSLKLAIADVMYKAKNAPWHALGLYADLVQSYPQCASASFDVGVRHRLASTISHYGEWKGVLQLAAYCCGADHRTSSPPTPIGDLFLVEAYLRACWTSGSGHWKEERNLIGTIEWSGISLIAAAHSSAIVLLLFRVARRFGAWGSVLAPLLEHWKAERGRSGGLDAAEKNEFRVALLLAHLHNSVDDAQSTAAEFFGGGSDGVETCLPFFAQSLARFACRCPKLLHPNLCGLMSKVKLRCSLPLRTLNEGPRAVPAFLAGELHDLHLFGRTAVCSINGTAYGAESRNERQRLVHSGDVLTLRIQQGAAPTARSDALKDLLVYRHSRLQVVFKPRGVSCDELARVIGDSAGAVWWPLYSVDPLEEGLVAFTPLRDATADYDVVELRVECIVQRISGIAPCHFVAFPDSSSASTLNSPPPLFLPIEETAFFLKYTGKMRQRSAAEDKEVVWVVLSLKVSGRTMRTPVDPVITSMYYTLHQDLAAEGWKVVGNVEVASSFTGAASAPEDLREKRTKRVMRVFTPQSLFSCDKRNVFAGV